MTRIAVVALLAIAACATAGCDGSTRSIVEPDPVIAAGDTIRATRGRNFEVSLLACLASCGYGWEFTRAFDDEMALLVDYTIASTDTLCGSPQEQRWTYLARKTGTDVATLCYWPLFEPDPEPLRVRNIVLIVGE
ncbi:MAG: protease inhibitor I42 family protein [Candidatus Krumholzibacteriota bacterium]|nr:protease inhibitor I42 family protein [Candidatus Krumholzibacteriota bacterium]